MNQEETKEVVPENTTPVDETEISDTELENISGGAPRPNLNSTVSEHPGWCR